MKLCENMLKKLVVLTVLCVLGSSSVVFGQMRSGDAESDEDRREIVVYDGVTRLEQKRKAYDRRINDLAIKINTKKDANGVPLTKEQLIRLKNQFAAANRALDSLFTPGNALGRIVADGIAGKHLGDSDIDGVGDGVWKGITARTAQAFGDVISKRAQGTMEHVLGGTWDFVADSMVNGYNELNITLFHNSKKPLDITLITGWEELILGSLGDIELILKDYLKESSRGHDKSLRQFDADQPAEEANSGWRDLVAGDIEIFDSIIHDIEERKDYYTEDDPIVHFANQIQKRLLKFRNLLEKAKTIKELDASFDSNRSIVEALRKNLQRLFKHLTDLVTPKSYSSSERNGASSQAGRAQAQKSKLAHSKYGRDTDREEDFPGSMWK